MAAINFFSEDVTFKIPHPRKTSDWIKVILKKEGKILSSLNYIFCSDVFLLSLNQSYLKHNTLTDIITFNYAEDTKHINGEVYISIERVSENATEFEAPFQQELNRVIIHGVLHLIGYRDKSKAEKAEMRKKESACLSLYR